MKQTIKITSPPLILAARIEADRQPLDGECFLCRRRAQCCNNRSGWSSLCGSHLFRGQDSGKKTNEVNRSERRYTVDSVQCFSSKHWAVCPLLLAQPVDFRLSLISNQLKSFEFLRLNTSKFFGLGSWRRSSKVGPRQITSNQPKGGRKLTIKAVGSTMFVPTTNYNY